MTDYTSGNRNNRSLDVMAALWKNNSTQYDVGGDRENKHDKILDAFARIYGPMLYTPEEIAAGLTDQQRRKAYLYGLKAVTNSYIDEDQFEQFGKEDDAAE